MVPVCFQSISEMTFISFDESFEAREQFVLEHADEFPHVLLQAAYLEEYLAPGACTPGILYKKFRDQDARFWRADGGGFELVWKTDSPPAAGVLAVYVSTNGRYSVRCGPADSKREAVWLWDKAASGESPFEEVYVSEETDRVPREATSGWKEAWHAIVDFYWDGNPSPDLSWMAEAQFESQHGYPVIDHDREHLWPEGAW